MSAPIQRIYRQPEKKAPRQRTKPPQRVECRPHVNDVLENYPCIAAGKISKITGRPHVCEGSLDPHHSPTRGAGGGDDNVCPVCRGLHSLIDTPNHSEKSVEDEFGFSFRETGAYLWMVSPERPKYERKMTMKYGLLFTYWYEAKQRENAA